MDNKPEVGETILTQTPSPNGREGGFSPDQGSGVFGDQGAGSFKEDPLTSSMGGAESGNDTKAPAESVEVELPKSEGGGGENEQSPENQGGLPSDESETNEVISNIASE